MTFRITDWHPPIDGVARAESRYDVIDGLSARVVLGSGQKKIHGPIPEIEADLLFAHRDFWRR